MVVKRIFEIELSEEQDAALTKVASDSGVDPQTCARRLVLVGLHMFPGFVSDAGFELAMGLDVVNSGLEPTGET